MSEITPRAILIAGPTASGKSALALALAERLGGTVINADSMQVYRELRILTARPTPAEEARVPHALYGHVSGAEAYSVGRWLADAAEAIAVARAAGRRPIVVGGTGLYFRTLLEGLSPIPAIPVEVRAKWRARAEKEPASALHRLLADCDPAAAARLASGDTQRVVRALEVLEATGRSLTEWQRLAGTPVLAAAEAVRLVVMPDRAELRRRCAVRFEAMLQEGGVEEARRLARLDLDPALPVMRAIGVRPLLKHLAGEIDREEATRQAVAETQQYVKRQVTWLRRHMIAWQSIFAQEMQSMRREVLSVIDMAVDPTGSSD
jgi:tRNA dimethylallyltransferase